ncbi:MAG: hypothetical protein ACLTAC_14740, partial [Hungatella sp.]
EYNTGICESKCIQIPVFFMLLGKYTCYIKSPPGRMRTSRQENMAAEATALRRERPASRTLSFI